MLDLSKDFGVKNFVFASSSSVYGDAKKVPFSEGNSADKPVSPYAASKRAGELFCHFYSSIHKLPVTCLRFFTVYGPRQRPTMAIHKITRWIDNGVDVPMFNDGSSRDYTYISDIIDGLMATINKRFPYEVINLGSSNPIKEDYLVSLIEQSIGKKAKLVSIKKPVNSGDVFITYADLSKAQKLLGYSPKVLIEDGIKLFADWYKKNKKILYND